MAFPSVLGQFRNTPAQSIGGAVIALLLKAKKRPKPQLQGSEYQPREHLMAGVIPVSARHQEQYMFHGDATVHPVENGANLSDHVILRPVRIELIFDVNNIPDSSRAKAILEQMTDMWQGRQPVSLMTEHSLLNDMVCTSFQAVNESPEWGKLCFRAMFQQIKKITLESAKYEKSKVTPSETTKGPAVAKSAQSPKKNGVKTPKKKSLRPGNTSAASKISSTLFGKD